MTAQNGLISAGRLENYANNVSTLPISASERRVLRYENRGVLWEISALERLRKCGRVSVSGNGLVGVRCAHGVAGFSGLATCASVWACPVCNAKIMAVRAIEIGSAVTTAQSRGVFVGMVTLTMKHHLGQSLAELWDALATAWRRAISGREWAERRSLGWVGQLRAVEVTYGPNGWHVHVHVLVFLGDPRSLRQDVDVTVGQYRQWRENFETLAVGMWNRWASGLRSAGLDDPLLVGQDWHEISGMGDLALSQYLTKSTDSGSIGVELTSSQTKGATWSKTLPPWSYLNWLRLTGESSAARVWREYELASHGRRQLTWSNGLRDLVQLPDEQTDEEIATEEVGSASDTVVFITPAGWKSITQRGRRHLIPGVLDAVSAGGWDRLQHFLNQHGIEHLREVEDHDEGEHSGQARQARGGGERGSEGAQVPRTGPDRAGDEARRPALR